MTRFTSKSTAFRRGWITLSKTDWNNVLDKKSRIDDSWEGEKCSALESALIKNARLGEWASLEGKFRCPSDTLDPNLRVRAGLIRHLLLAESEENPDVPATHARGLQLAGAWVDGTLDFQGCKTKFDCRFSNCLFPEDIVFRDAEMRGLFFFGGVAEKKIDLLRLRTANSLHFSNGFYSKKTINLRGSRIGMQFFCGGAIFGSPGSDPNTRALDCTGAKIGADAIMCFSKWGRDEDVREAPLEINGMADFSRSHIGGHLRFENATLNGVFRGEAMHVMSTFFWRKVAGNRARIDLSLAEVGVLCDDPDSWGSAQTFLHLEGFQYGQVLSPFTLADRLMWLERNCKATWDRDANTYTPTPASSVSKFRPQPYTQLAKVLSRSGYRNGAAKVRFVRERQTRLAEFSRAWERRNDTCWRIIPLVWPTIKLALDVLYWGLFGFGHSPMRAFWVIFFIVASAGYFYGQVYNSGQMAPNSSVILTSFDWQHALTQSEVYEVPPLWIWSGKNGYSPLPSAIDYETFNQWLYAIDLFLPLDSIGQESAWAPSLERGSLGKLGYYVRFWVQLAGWVITAAGAAVLTGLVGKSDD